MVYIRVQSTIGTRQICVVYNMCFKGLKTNKGCVFFYFRLTHSPTLNGSMFLRLFFNDDSVVYWKSADIKKNSAQRVL